MSDVYLNTKLYNLIVFSFFKRNPDIKLYALPWGFPGWVGQGTQRPYTNDNITADYIVRWINGSSYVHGLHIDYVGVSK